MVMAGGAGKRWTSPLSCITEKGELRDNENLSSSIEERAVEVALFVAEYPEMHGLAGDIAGVFFRVITLDTEKKEYSPLDFCDALSFNLYFGAACPLDHAYHSFSVR